MVPIAEDRPSPAADDPPSDDLVEADIGVPGADIGTFPLGERNPRCTAWPQILASNPVVVGIKAMWIGPRTVLFKEALGLGVTLEVRAVAIAEGAGRLSRDGESGSGDNEGQHETTRK